ARQYPCCMVVIKQLSAKFQIQLSLEFRNSLLNVLLLATDIFVVVKADFQAKTPLFTVNAGMECPRRRSVCFVFKKFNSYKSITFCMQLARIFCLPQNKKQVIIFAFFCRFCLEYTQT